MNDVHKDNSRAGLLIMVLLILMLVAVSAALTLTLYMTGQAYQERLVIDYGVSVCHVKADEIRAGKGSPARSSWSDMQTACLAGVTEDARREAWSAVRLR